jgi:hypothetical protein
MERRSRGYRSVARWLTIPLVLLCIGAQVGSATHFVLVRHRICPEHGELVDAARAHGTAAALDVTTRISAEAPSESWGPHGHDHCLFALDRRERECQAATAERAALPVQAAAVAPPGAVAVPPAGTALYFIAPKSSPPA